MLFYRTMPEQRVPTRTSAAAPVSGAWMRGVWMVKCFMTGVALLGLAYWLIQIAGAQYLATLTSATLLSFLLVYIVWCLTVKRRHLPQNTDSVGAVEPPAQPTTSSGVPRMSLHLNPALKHFGVPPRDCSPPPTYEEVLLQMAAAAAAASTSGATPNDVTTPNDVEAPPDTLPGASPSRINIPECNDVVETVNETTTPPEPQTTTPTTPTTPRRVASPTSLSDTEQVV